MSARSTDILPTYLAGLQVESGLCGLNTVSRSWRDIDYIPAYSKFYFILEGEGWLKVGGREFCPRPGQMALMPEGKLQSYACGEGPSFRKYWCHFNARFGSASLFDLIDLPLVVDVPPAEAPSLTALFQSLLDHPDDASPTAVIHRKVAVLGLVAWYLEHCPGGRILDGTGQRLAPALGLIEARLATDLTLEELAASVHLQPAYFTRLFRRHFGLSPFHYIQKRRIEEIKRLLALPGLTVTEIGERVGIGNPQYLARLFKEHTGFSPSQFRELGPQR